MVHGDDFIIIAKDEGRSRTLNLLQSHFDIKHQTAGPKQGMDKELRVLGRIAISHSWGWSLEADPCLIESAVSKLNRATSKGTATPPAKLEMAGSGNEVKSRRLDPRPVHEPEAAWPGFDVSHPLSRDDLKR